MTGPVVGLLLAFSLQAPLPETDRKTVQEKIPFGATRCLGNTRLRPPRPVTSLVFSPDGARLAAAAGGGMWVWDLPRGDLFLTIPDHGWPRNSLAFASDGGTLISAGADHRPHIWDARTGKILHSFAKTVSPLSSMSVSPDRSRMAVADQHGRITVYDPPSQDPVSTFQHKMPIPSFISFLKDSRTLVVTENRSISVRDVVDLEIKGTIGTGSPISAMATSPDGKTVAYANWRNEVVLWDTSGEKGLRKFKIRGGSANCLAFSADGSLLSGGARVIHLWDIATEKEKRVFEGHKKFVKSVTFSSDGKWIAAGDDDGVILVWNADTGERMGGTPGPVGSPSSLVYAPGDGEIVTGCNDGTVRIWDRRAGRLLRTLPGHDNSVTGVSFNSDGSRLVTSSYDMALKAREVTTGKLIWSTKSSDFDLHRERSWGASTHDDGIRIWEPDSGKPVANLKIKIHISTGLGFRPDGRLVCASPEGDILILELPSGRELLKMGTRAGHFMSPLLVSPDGKLVAWSNAVGWIYVWEIAGNRPVQTIRSRKRSQGLPMIFSPDSRYIVGGTFTGMTFWEIGRVKPVHQVLTPGNSIQALAYSRSGSVIAAGMADSTILEWTVPVRPRTERSTDVAESRKQWDLLGDHDPKIAYGAGVWFLEEPSSLYSLIRKAIQPKAHPDIVQLFVNLNADDLALREQATDLLLDYAPVQEAEKALQAATTAETKYRLKMILEGVDRPVYRSSTGLRWHRVIRLLEQAGGGEARKVLKEIIETPLYRISAEAAQALKRLQQK